MSATTFNWYALQVRTGFEMDIANKVLQFAKMRNFSDHVYDVFAGVKKIIRMTGKGRKLEADPVLTGYIFVKVAHMSNEVWHFLKSVPGVYRVLDMLPISSEEIERMHDNCRGEVEIRMNTEEGALEQTFETIEIQESQETERGLTVNVGEEVAGTQCGLNNQNIEFVQSQSANEEEETILKQVMRSFTKGAKEIWRIPIAIYNAAMEFDPGLRDRKNEGNPRYILAAIRNFALHVMREVRA
jgi:transcription antitermination factor NusG